MAAPSQLNERKFDESISLVLRTGVIIAACLVLAGGVVYVIQQDGAIRDYHSFKSEPPELRSVSGILYAALAFRAPALIQIGLLVLIATPIARVALSVAMFLYEKDWTYVAVTLVVLAMLLYSLLGRQVQ